MPPKENLERDCEECIHYWACSRQCGEPMAQSSATGCECYETVKSIAAARLIERLTAENAALEKQLGAASKESILKKLEINEKLRELDELHRMVDGIPPEILQAAKQVAAHKPQER